MAVSRAATLITLLTLLGAGSALARSQDALPPRIIHQPVAEAYSDTNLVVRAQVIAEAPVEQVTLFFRTPGAGTYYYLQMRGVRGEYRVAIPASYMQAGTIEYYIQATDATGSFATYPSRDAAQEPLRVEVKKDTSIPWPELLATRAPSPGEAWEAFIVIGDAAGNVDPSSIRVYWNEEDVTAKAKISGTSVLYEVPARDVLFASWLTVEVADLAGNRSKRSFRLLQEPRWQHQLRAGLETGHRPAVSLDTSVEWGPLYLSGSLASGDDCSEQLGQFGFRGELHYNARLMRLSVGDITSRVAPLALSSLRHQGGDVQLQLGPLSLQGVYGFAEPDALGWGRFYQRRLVALRSALDTSGLDLAFSVVKVRDEWQAGNDLGDANPEVNYVFDAQAGVGALGGRAGIDAEVAVSLYHDNARGDLWPLLASLGDDHTLRPELQALIEVLNQVPPKGREFLALPDIRYGLPKLDAGAQVALWLPLPWSEFTARGYRFGKAYQTIAGAGESNVEGYSASYGTIRFFNILQLSAGYERSMDNVPSLMEMALKVAPTPRTESQEYGAKVSMGPTGGLNINLGATRTDQGPAGMEEPEQRTRGYTLELRNVRFDVGTARARIGASGGLVLTQALADPSRMADKSTISYKVSAGLDAGAWSYDLVCGAKHEAGGAGSGKATNPSIAASVARTWRQPQVLGGRWQDIRVRALFARDRATGEAGGEAAKNTWALEGSSRVTADTRVAASWRWTRQGDGRAATELKASLRWWF